MAEPAALRAVGADGLAGISDRVLAVADDVVARMGQALAAEIPEYGQLTARTLTERVLPTSRLLVVAFFQALREGRPIRPREVRELAASGRSRLGLGVPLDAVLHAYRLGGRVTWEAVVAAIRPGEEALLAPLAAAWMSHIDTVSSAVAKDYLDASHERLRTLDARRRGLLEAVLAAREPAELAAVAVQHSTTLAAAYVPVLVSGTGAAGRIDALVHRAPRGTLAGHRDAPGEGRVLLLVPVASAAPVTVAPVPAADDLVTWGRPTSPGPDLTDEVGHVERTMAAALAQGTTRGAFGPDDLLVEQLLLADPRVAEGLARRVLAPLATDPSGQLRATLAAWLDTGSTAEVARLVVVHPNTVGYRLGRIRELTGLDPRVPAQSAVLVLALRGLQTGGAA